MRRQRRDISRVRRAVPAEVDHLVAPGTRGHGVQLKLAYEAMHARLIRRQVLAAAIDGRVTDELGEGAAADAIARLEHSDGCPAGGQGTRRVQARQSGTDHHHINVMFRHDHLTVASARPAMFGADRSRRAVPTTVGSVTAVNSIRRNPPRGCSVEWVCTLASPGAW